MERKKKIRHRVIVAKAEKDQRQVQLRKKAQLELRRLYNKALKNEEAAYKAHIGGLDNLEKELEELSTQLRTNTVHVERLDEGQKKQGQLLTQKLRQLQVTCQKHLDRLKHQSHAAHSSADKRCNALLAQLRMLSDQEAI